MQTALKLSMGQEAAKQDWIFKLMTTHMHARVTQAGAWT